MSRSITCAAVCCVTLLLFFDAASYQLRTVQAADSGQTADDLSRRLEAAMEARKSGDLGAIGLATERVIALGLVDMAKLRLDDKAYDEAVKLCRDSLEFEDTPETHVELAIASLYARKPSDAVQQASIATEMNPQNALAWNIKGEALLQSKDFSEAATALTKSLELKPDAESMYALGRAYLGMGEKEKATETFSQMLTLTGDFGWSRILVGRAYKEAKLFQEAEEEFRNALRLDPRTPNAQYFWALTLLQANYWSPTPEVREHLQEELKLSPRHFLANYLLGVFTSVERNYDESDRYLRLAAELNPSLPEIWMYLGLNANARNARRSAEDYFRKAITLKESGNPNEHLSVRQAYFVLGRILMSSGRRKEAQNLLRKGQELRSADLTETKEEPATTQPQNTASVNSPVVPFIPEAESRNSFAVGAERSVSDFQSSHPFTKLPQDPAAKTKKQLRTLLGSSLNDLATAEALQAKYDLAVKHYHQAAKWDSRIPGLGRNLGLAMYFVGEPGEAIRLLASVVKTTPKDDHARAVLGLAYFETRRFAEARQIIAPIANQTIQDTQLGFAWAKSLAETGSKIGAARALERMEKSGLKLNVEELTHFGQLWADLGEIERAVEFFHRALGLDPANADAKCALGTALIRLSRRDEAVELFSAVLAAHPEHAESHHQLGLALLNSQNLPDAIRHLEEAERLQPESPSIHLDLESAYRKAGRTTDADREHAFSGTKKISTKK